mmetsp:Transcript_29883/g.62883  ORF Transcript_29883/g.62883 Transcript_29883/m.62883 type:complete len:220 (-) Transcript_29883:292-951(-)
MAKITFLDRFFFTTSLLFLSIGASASNNLIPTVESATIENGIKRLSSSTNDDKLMFFDDIDNQNDIESIAHEGYIVEANLREEVSNSSSLHGALHSSQSFHENHKLTSKNNDITKNNNSPLVGNPHLKGTQSVNKKTRRELRDIEAILNEMSNKPPETWSASEWVVFVIFLCMMGWIASCICALCCCGGNSNLLGWFCLWEICCRDGRDIDACCNYGLA